MKTKKGRKNALNYAKYGYMFIAPFFIVYAIFSFWPLLKTFYYSFFEYTTRNLKTTVTFAGFQNYANALGIAAGEHSYFLDYLGNTLRMWVFSFIPQILLSLLVAAWLTNRRTRIKRGGIYKILVYMPNIITAGSISLLFAALLSKYGPIMSTLRSMGWISANTDVMSSQWGTSLSISFILFWMWYGNTSLLLIAGMLGIDTTLYESAEMDGANGRQQFMRITLPLLRPVLLYTLVTSVIGGLQLYDIPALFNAGQGTAYMGGPNDTSTTVAMYIMRLHSSDTGKASAVSVLLFLITLAISLIFFRVFRDNDAAKQAKIERQKMREARKLERSGALK